jgi:hypothetical protein
MPKWCREPLKGWEDIIARFPDAIIDIEECLKCLACMRSAGAVFHAMLVAEFGVIQTGSLIGVTDPKMNFASVVKEMQRIVHRTPFTALTPDQQKNHPFIVQVLPLPNSCRKRGATKSAMLTGHHWF